MSMTRQDKAMRIQIKLLHYETGWILERLLEGVSLKSFERRGV